MNLSPVDAINRIGESVTVDLVVQRTKLCCGSKQCFLDSEANHRAPNNLGVVVTEVGRAKFGEAGIDDHRSLLRQDDSSSWGGRPKGERGLH